MIQNTETPYPSKIGASWLNTRALGWISSIFPRGICKTVLEPFATTVTNFAPHSSTRGAAQAPIPLDSSPKFPLNRFFKLVIRELTEKIKICMGL